MGIGRALINEIAQKITGQSTHTNTLESALIDNALSPTQHKSPTAVLEHSPLTPEAPPEKKLPSPEGVSLFGRAMTAIMLGNPTDKRSGWNDFKIVTGLGYGLIFNIPPNLLQRHTFLKGMPFEEQIYYLMQTPRDRQYLTELRAYLNSKNQSSRQ